MKVLAFYITKLSNLTSAKIKTALFWINLTSTGMEFAKTFDNPTFVDQV